MLSKLCSVCQTIPQRIWLREWRPDDAPVELQTQECMRLSADVGCSLCIFFTRAIDSARTSAIHDRIDLSSATAVTISKFPFSDSKDAFLSIGPEFTLPITIHSIPEPWSAVHPIEELVEPINNIRLMGTWLSNCLLKHGECSKTSGHALPSRLLDLDGNDSQSNIRLVSTVGSKDKMKYVALSHCWGHPRTHPLKTIKENLQDHLLQIPLTSLSNTFHDAVDITRQLGIRYLWIDSLCIVQNDEDDWASEAAQMAVIYDSAECTLAALSSHDSTGGCRRVTDIQASTGPFTDLELYPEDTNHTCRVRIFARTPISWEREYYNRIYGERPHKNAPWITTDPLDLLLDAEQGASEAPLKFRAWVRLDKIKFYPSFSLTMAQTLQETELSPRIVHFGKNQVLWECRQLKATAQLPWAIPLPGNQYQFYNELNFDDEDAVFPAEFVPIEDPRFTWRRLVEDYSLRSLSFGKDKLPALAGLAKMYQATYHDSKYVAGIWTKHLPSALLWKSLKTTTRRFEPYVAPSWSWASLNGPVTHVLGRWNQETNEIEYSEENDRMIWCEYGRTESSYRYSTKKQKACFINYTHVDEIPWGEDFPVLEDTKTSPKYQDPYGAITEAHLTLSNVYLVQISSINFYANSNSEYGRFGLKCRGHGVIHQDTLDDNINSETKLFVFRIERDVPCCHFWRGLVLVQVSEVEQTYRRFGIATCVDSRMFEDENCGPRRITLL